MTTKTKKTKTIGLHNVNQIHELYTQFQDKGETIKNIDFKDDDFKFEDGRLFLWGDRSEISSIDIQIREDKKVIRRTYKPKSIGRFYSLDDLKLVRESIDYQD